MKFLKVCSLAVLLAAFVTGCSSPPEEAERLANAAMESAATVKAAKYAPNEWRMAEDTLQTARSTRAAQDDRFTLFRNYGDAERLFNRTTALANNAKTAALAQLEVVKGEARLLLDQSAATIDSLSELLTKIRPRKDNRAEIEVLKQDLLAFAAQLAEAESDFGGGDYDAAKTKVDAVSARLSTIETEIRRATGRR